MAACPFITSNTWQLEIVEGEEESFSIWRLFYGNGTFGERKVPIMGMLIDGF